MCSFREYRELSTNSRSGSYFFLTSDGALVQWVLLVIESQMLDVERTVSIFAELYPTDI
jgi:hypothetical protein